MHSKQANVWWTNGWVINLPYPLHNNHWHQVALFLGRLNTHRNICLCLNKPVLQLVMAFDLTIFLIMFCIWQNCKRAVLRLQAHLLGKFWGFGQILLSQPAITVFSRYWNFSKLFEKNGPRIWPVIQALLFKKIHTLQTLCEGHIKILYCWPTCGFVVPSDMSQNLRDKMFCSCSSVNW